MSMFGIKQIAKNMFALLRDVNMAPGLIKGRPPK
jgi:hypothetical protein